jgi:hypothetical protein
MDIKKMSEEEIIDVMTQIKEICNDAHDCDECIFYKIYYNHPTQVCPFNHAPFRWDFGKEIKDD